MCLFPHDTSRNEFLNTNIELSQFSYLQLEKACDFAFTLSCKTNTNPKEGKKCILRMRMCFVAKINKASS